MPAKDPADYMRVYRARKKMPGDPPEIPENIPKNIPQENSPEQVTEKSPIENAEKPLDKKSTFRRLPSDGWVAALTQPQRDYLLDRINVHKGKAAQK